MDCQVNLSLHLCIFYMVMIIVNGLSVSQSSTDSNEFESTKHSSHVKSDKNSTNKEESSHHESEHGKQDENSNEHGVYQDCPTEDKCISQSMKSRKVDSTYERACACDQECADYNDCCEDSQWLDWRTKINVSCVSIDYLGAFFMITKCPDTTPDENQRALCENLENSEMDPMAQLPVTDLSKRLTYRNAHCAACHESLNITFWKVMILCDVDTSKYSREYIEANIQWSSGENHLELKVQQNGKDEYRKCIFSFRFPTGIQTVLRPCRANIIDSCPTNSDEELVKKCSRFQSPRYYSDKQGTFKEFRNLHCAQCHNMNLSELSCYPNRGTPKAIDKGKKKPGHYNVAFSILLDVSPTGNVPGKSTNCPNPNQTYDMFRKKCLDLYCGFRGHQTKSGRCENPSSSNSSFGHSKFDSCPLKTVLRGEPFIRVENGSIFIPGYNLTLKNGSYKLDDHSIWVCASSINQGISLNKFSPDMVIVTTVGLGVSIVALICHILSFILVKEVRNLSGQNLLCLSITLVIAYSSFILMQLGFVQRIKQLCVVVGFMVFFFFLASMAWMNVIALDILRTLRLATVELRVTHGSQKMRFWLYSAYAWSLSIVIFILALIADVTPNLFPEEYQPGFGNSGPCWFSHRKALILFFAAPVGLIMCVNLTAFIFSAFMLKRTTTKTSSLKNSRFTGVDHKLYLKLLLLMGLTWISGYVASSADSIYLWYLFIVLNTTQGLFIFIAFSCKRRVARNMRKTIGQFSESVTKSTHISHTSFTNT
ncbi:uncharacterized protein LOC141849322 [Brevipalpus obovatus]|uniref:uncharacterized protein LOC141849322 n=1 Tax=Brevipalpus obovatus TaxID=246614 RepID=UPI003D9DB479